MTAHLDVPTLTNGGLVLLLVLIAVVWLYGRVYR